MNKTLLISIVSHGQLNLIVDLLKDLSSLSFDDFSHVHFVLTLNIEEDESFLQGIKLPLQIIRNAKPLGFGHNHNNAFDVLDSDFFLILNPDIRIYEEITLSFIDSNAKSWGCFGPLVYSSGDNFEDSARKFPSIWRITKRVLFNKRSSDYPDSTEKTLPISVDWIGGMFVLFKSSVFKNVGGFDTNYFMYLEDADICRRIHACGYDVLLTPNLRVIHDARRSTLKSWRHFRWHLRSMVRFLFKI